MTVDLAVPYRVREQEVVAKTFDDEVIVINLANSVYYSIRDSGAYAWQQIGAGVPPGAIAAVLSQATDVDRAAIERDLDTLLAQLIEEGLVEPASDSTPAPVVPPHANGSYLPPVFERYDDMQDLLALDLPMPDVDDSDRADEPR